jgi:hypothetical protein
MGTWSSWDNPNYCWVVICKNTRFHRQVNTMFGHKIPLGETDAFSPPPAFDGQFHARCDECGEEYEYDPAVILRAELTPPSGFAPHPLFK